MNSETPEGASVSTGVHTLIDVFRQDLEGVEFPDVDHAILDDHVRAVTDAADAVDRAEQSVRDARDALREHQRALLDRAQRGLAYARIYAADHDGLAAKLATIELGITSATPRKKATRGRKRAPPKPSSEALPFSGDRAQSEPTEPAVHVVATEAGIG